MMQAVHVLQVAEGGRGDSQQQAGHRVMQGWPWPARGRGWGCIWNQQPAVCCLMQAQALPGMQEAEGGCVGGWQQGVHAG